MTRIYLSPPHMGGDELKFVNEAFDTNWIAPVGPHVDGFEKDLCSYNGIEHSAVLSSGTAAIHLALTMLGVKQGDEVLCSTFTFSASCNPIVYLGGIPVFVDSEKETWNMDPELLRVAIDDRLAKGKKPKAIVLVHLYGMPAKMKELMAVVEEYQIPVVEDAAEALGSKYHEQPLGTFGDMGVFSFNGNKIITTSGGGALVSRNEGYISKARFLSTQARDEAPHYQHSQIGYNYRMSNVLAGVGRGQMRVLNQWIDNRRFNYNYYHDNLEGLSGIEFLIEPEGFYSNRWLTTILIDEISYGADRETLRLSLEEENIESRPLWKPMHLQPVFKEYPSYTNGISEALFRQGLCLPSGSNLTEHELSRVCTVLQSPKL